MITSSKGPEPCPAMWHLSCFFGQPTPQLFKQSFQNFTVPKLHLFPGSPLSFYSEKMSSSPILQEKKREVTRSPSSSCDQAHMYPSSFSAVAIEELSLPPKADLSTCTLNPVYPSFLKPLYCQPFFSLSFPFSLTHTHFLFHAAVFFFLIFIDYAITVVPFPTPLTPLHPAHPLPPTFHPL